MTTIWNSGGEGKELITKGQQEREATPVVSWQGLNKGQLSRLHALHRKYPRTYACNVCGYHKARNNPYPGTTTPGTFGKCVHRCGPCSKYVPSFGIGLKLPDGWSLFVIHGHITATDPDGVTHILKHVKEALIDDKGRPA